MEKIAAMFSRFSDSVDRLIQYLVFVIIVGMVTVTTLQVICRVFFTALAWSEELTRYLLVWGTFFAATMAYKRGNHIAITFLVGLFPRKYQHYFSILTYLISIGFFSVITYYGWQMMKLQVFQISPAMSLPMKYVYSAIPASLIIMSIHAVSGIFSDLLRISGKEVSA